MSVERARMRVQGNLIVTAVTVGTLLLTGGGCSSLVELTVDPDVAVAPRPAHCAIELGDEFAELPDACVEVGVLNYRAPLVPRTCDRIAAQRVAGERACEVGATHARIRWTEICVRARIEYFACPTSAKPPPSESSQRSPRESTPVPPLVVLPPT